MEVGDFVELVDDVKMGDSILAGRGARGKIRHISEMNEIIYYDISFYSGKFEENYLENSWVCSSHKAKKINNQKILEECLDKYKKLYGIVPYNDASNICYHDGFFAKSIADTYPEEIRIRALEIIENMQ